VNVADLLRDTAAAVPDKPALFFRGRPITYGELEERVDLTAAALAALGVAKGDRVALLAGNVPEFVYGLYGAMRAGAIVCPLNVMLTAEEFGAMLADCAAGVVITELGTLSELVSIRDRLPALHTVIVIGGPPAPPGSVSLEEAMSGAGAPPEVRAEPSDVAVIAYTAGTTAEPKGAVLTHANLLSNLDQMAQVTTLVPTLTDVVLVALPLFHSYALNVILGLTVKTGATAVLVERFDPAETLDLVERHGITFLVGAPPMFSALLEAAGDDRSRLDGVRLAVSGAAALPQRVFEGFRSRLAITIWEGYGLTEAGPAVSSNGVGPEAKAGSVGLPLPGVDLRLIDEFGEEVEEGDPGEILVHGPNVFAGYWKRPEESAAAFDGQWLRTGDVAYRDEDGYLFLVDRKRDLIIVSGFNVFPKEVEEAIERHPSVAEAAVVGIPEERTGEAVQAWVVPAEGRTLTEEGLLDFLHDHLARFKWPKDIRIVEQLPHHVTGKVSRRALRGDEGPEDHASQEDHSSPEDHTSPENHGPEVHAGPEEPGT
jgi:long-chain acyl-CoA synthetase